MKTMPRYRKSAVLSQKQREEMIADSASKANLMLTICVLHDCFGFGEKRINEFVDRYKEVANSCDRGADDWRKINEEIYERFGIKIV
jgi:hypothetical protein